MRRLSLLLVLTIAFLFTPTLKAQVYSAEQIEVAPPAPRVEAPAPKASVAELDKRGDELRAAKAYLDAIDYYQAALNKDPRNAMIQNKVGIAYMQLQRYAMASKCFRNSIRMDSAYSDARNNLGVIYYLQKSYGRAVKEYEVALKLRPDSAAYYGNLGAAYFAKKEPDKAMVAYVHALQLDPDVLNRSSRVGVVGQTTPAEERAFYDYMVAKAYAKLGLLDLSFEHLRKAIEEQYKDIAKVYKDDEFAGVRKDPRFTELMTAKPPSLVD
jgi:tetratricopeptide (TPR) repeat protein